MTVASNLAVKVFWPFLLVRVWMDLWPHNHLQHGSSQKRPWLGSVLTSFAPTHYCMPKQKWPKAEKVIGWVTIINKIALVEFILTSKQPVITPVIIAGTKRGRSNWACLGYRLLCPPMCGIQVKHPLIIVAIKAPTISDTKCQKLRSKLSRYFACCWLLAPSFISEFQLFPTERCHHSNCYSNPAKHTPRLTLHDVAAIDPIIVGTKDPKIESPRGANGPMRPVLIPLTASLELTPSFLFQSQIKTSDNGGRMEKYWRIAYAISLLSIRCAISIHFTVEIACSCNQSKSSSVVPTNLKVKRLFVDLFKILFSEFVVIRICHLQISPLSHCCWS